MKPGPGGGPSIGPGGVPSFGRREGKGIGLDYINNLIMEKMRNENSDEMKTEDGHGKHETGTGPPTSVANKNLPGGNPAHAHNPPTSIVHGHPSHLGGLAGRIAAVAAAQARDRDDNGPNSESHRGGDSQVCS